MQGSVTCPNEEDFEKMRTTLENGGWLKDMQLYDATGSAVSKDPNLLPALLTLTVPLGYYRNLAGKLFADSPERTGRMVCTTTDGELSGWVEGPQPLGSTPLYPVYTIGSPPTHDYAGWQRRAEMLFHTQYADNNDIDSDILNWPPSVEIDIFGDSPRMQIIVQDSEDEAVAYIRFGPDMQTADEVLVHERKTVVRGERVTAWEDGRDRPGKMPTVYLGPVVPLEVGDLWYVIPPNSSQVIIVRIIQTAPHVLGASDDIGEYYAVEDCVFLVRLPKPHVAPQLVEALYQQAHANTKAGH